MGRAAWAARLAVAAIVLIVLRHDYDEPAPAAVGKTTAPPARAPYAVCVHPHFTRDTLIDGALIKGTIARAEFMDEHVFKVYFVEGLVAYLRILPLGATESAWTEVGR